MNKIVYIRAIIEVLSSIGVGPLYECKQPEKNDNLNIVMISGCSENGTQVAHVGIEDLRSSRRKIVLLYQADEGKGRWSEDGTRLDAS